jgi:transcriptional regulator with XRE-family HTH domain
MRRLHLKLFYLRTRYKREPQGVTARTLGVRPATMSHLEQGRSLPTLKMLEALSRHYDVTPTYLLDDERPIEPQARDRWSQRNSSVCEGDWLEVPEGAAIRAGDGKLLCPVMKGASFYDSRAQAERMLCGTDAAVDELNSQLRQNKKNSDQALEEMLQRELDSQKKPRTKKRAPAAAAPTNGAATNGAAADGEVRIASDAGAGRNGTDHAVHTTRRSPLTAES